MKDNYSLFTPLPWIATPAARNDGRQLNDRHCEGVADDRGNPVQEGEWKSIKAFSLIELLISLIVISLIITAFMPVLTKKLKYQNATLPQGAVTTDCSKFDEQNRCLMCTIKGCALCTTQFKELKGYYVNPETGCEYQKCENKYPNCATCDKYECLSCNKGYFIKNKQCAKITDAPCLTVGNLCITNTNPPDMNSLPLPYDITIINAVSSNAAAAQGVTKEKICWRGRTSRNCTSDRGSYSGCYRTVCTWHAAKHVCESHGWRLPSTSELYVFSDQRQALQLCDRSVGALNACPGASGSPSTRLCPLSQGGNCPVDTVWSAQYLNNETDATLFTLYENKWNVGNSAVNTGRSFRCVRDL